MKMWKDETGREIPDNRITKKERKAEKLAAKIKKESVKINRQLSLLKETIIDGSADLLKMTMKENGIKESDYKGNYTWFNFDRSIKIQVDISESVRFDDAEIMVAKKLLFEFLEDNLSTVEGLIKSLVIDAFQQRSGKLDVKRILSLTKHKDRVKDKRFQDACEMIIKAQRRPESRKYCRVFLQEADGNYKNIDLNISSI